MTQRIQIVELKQSLCVNTHGTAPCTATGTKCYNTYATCQDTANFDDTDSTLDFRFHTECENPGLFSGLFPTIQSITPTPAFINVASADPDKQPLGRRAEAKVTLMDHPYHDRFTDPYFRTRSYNPLNRGTFWSKWLARNDQYEGLPVIVYDGFEGDLLIEMQESHYILEKISGPDSSGKVTLHLTDILKRADNDRATVPPISEGFLAADLNDSATEFDVTPAGAGTATYDDGTLRYPATGTITIGGGQEIITYTRSGDTFTIVRGSSPSSYNEGDIVQIAEIMDEEDVDDIVYRWLTRYVGVPTSWITQADWQTEFDDYIPLATISAEIYRPTGANEMIGEILRDTGSFLIPDLINKKIEFKALRSLPVKKYIDDSYNILLGSFKQTRRPELRLTQLWLFYNQRDVFGSSNDPGNFSKWKITPAANFARANIQKIKRIYSRFLKIDNLVLAETTSQRIMERFGAEPVEYEFALDGQDAATLGLGEVAVIDHRELVDQHGERQPRTVQVVSRHETERGGKVMYKAQAFDFTFATVLWPDPGTGFPEWSAATDEQKGSYAFFADDDGLIDGEEAPKLG
jgi:hypothetical protein